MDFIEDVKQFLLVKFVKALFIVLVFFSYLLLFYHVSISSYLLYLKHGHEAYWWYVIDIVLLLFEMISLFGIVQFLKTGIVSLDEVEIEIPKIKDYVDVDVFIPIKNESPEILENTLSGFMEQTYPLDKIHVFVGTETKDSNLISQYLNVCKKFGATFVNKENNQYKAGMLNILLKESSSPIILTFDYDHRPLKDGVYSLVAMLLNSEDSVAFVQGKAKFKGIINSLHAWSALLYNQYFEVVNVAKSKIGTVLYNGTAAAFKRNILEKVGGFPTKTFTEDAELTVNFLINGYHGVFLNKSCSVGLVPKNYTSQLSQLWRWTHGGVSVFKYYYKKIIKTPYLSITQKIDALSTYGLFFVLVGAYLYVGFVWIGLATGNTITRPNYYILPSSLITPLVISFVYAVLALLSGFLAKIRENEKIPSSLMLFSLIISVATNPFLLGAVFYAALGKQGPNDPKGKWSKNIHVTTTSILFLILGFFLIFSGVNYYEKGFFDGFLLIVIGLTLLPTFFLHLKYDYLSKDLTKK